MKPPPKIPVSTLNDMSPGSWPWATVDRVYKLVRQVEDVRDEAWQKAVEATIEDYRSKAEKAAQKHEKLTKDVLEVLRAAAEVVDAGKRAEIDARTARESVAYIPLHIRIKDLEFRLKEFINERKK